MNSQTNYKPLVDRVLSLLNNLVPCSLVVQYSDKEQMSLVS